MRVLFASSEIYPYAKSGGLADVADALPHAMQKEVDISRVMPLYGFIDTKGLKSVETFKINLSGISYDITVYAKNENKITTYFIKAPLLSQTQNLYGDENGDYGNNDLRFAIFSMGVVELAYEQLDECDRVYSSLKFDIRKNCQNRLKTKIQSVEKVLNREVNHS